MPLQATSGAASYDAFGGGVAAVPQYIEDVFSTYLYTGNGSTQTITNNIDLSTKGGLVWLKDRGGNNWGHSLFDTARGAGNRLISSTTAAQGTGFGQTFTTSGFDLDGNANYNWNGDDFVSWTWRKQPKYFDIQTWTGTGSNTTIAHSLGSVPGCIIVKRTDTTAAWAVYHRSLANTQYLVLNTTAAAATGATWWNSTTPTSAVFSVGTDASVNASGGTYVAYIFAHDAGGFGLTGTDNVITCGTFTTDASSNATITLGYEPQWVLFKSSSSAAQSWKILDNMRGFPAAVASGPNSNQLNPASAVGETGYGQVGPTATGWGTTIGQFGLASETYIYIAIRRGPMKVPTSGTSVFAPVLTTNDSAWTAGFPVDMFIEKWRADTTDGNYNSSRLTGARLRTQETEAEVAPGWGFFASNTQAGAVGNYGNLGQSIITHNFRRAPNFFDVVCYTGTGANTTFSHNLGVVPELMIVKRRNTANAWAVYANNDNTDYLVLNTTAATADDNTYWNDTSPTSSVFSVGTNNAVNASASTYVAYLFATCAGVSKVGSYTGNGSSQTINCGFTGGARFVLIKKTSGTGDWMVSDSARGIVAGSDPYIELNNTNAEVTGEDWLDTDSTGFVVNEVSGSNANTNGATYIFLAIA